MISDVTDSYRQAVRLLPAFLVTHVFFRLISAAVLVPFIGFLIGVTVGFSNQTALTDQDIARFLLTPAGATGAILTAAVTIAAATLDIAVMTATLRSLNTRPFTALRKAIGFAIGSAPILLLFALHLLVRIILLAGPFLALAGYLFFTRLSEFDINYYITVQPPEFMRTVVLIGFLALAMTGIVLHRLSGWALSLHLVLFEHVPVSKAFAESRKRMVGHRRILVGTLGIWLAARFALAAGVSAFGSALLVAAPDLFPNNLGNAAIAVIVALGLSLLLTTVLNAISNGALADLLNDFFDLVTEGSAPAFDVASAPAPSEHTRTTAVIVLAATVVLSFGSLGTGALVVERVSADADVDIIAHRGAAGARPENTMAAVLKAIEDGADWVEIDVQESADGEVIVFHDSDFMKAAGMPLKVWDASVDELADIDIGSWFAPEYADERTPLLKDVLEAAKGRAKLIIELKYYGYDVDLENRVIDIVEDTDMADQIATMSLKYPAVQKIIALRPDWKTGVLAATAVGDLSGLDGDFLAINTGQVSSGLLRRADAAGKDVYAWTVNEATTMSRMISIGIDGLITDEPALARKVIAERNALPTTARFALWISDTFGVTFDQLTTSEQEP